MLLLRRHAWPLLLTGLTLLLAACGPAVRWDPHGSGDGSAPQEEAHAADGATWGSWSAGESRPDFYTVERGDTLYSIAWRHDLDWRDMARWNGLGSADLIFPGQRLRLRPPPGGAPGGGPQVAAASPPAAPGREAPAAPQASAEASASDDSDDAAQADTGSRSGDRSGGGSGAASQPDSTAAVVSPPATSGANGTPQWQWPAPGPVVYRFGDSSALGNGLGLGGETGDPVRAAAAGSVVYTGRGLIGYGELVILKHDDTYLSAYGHTQDVSVSQGEEVAAGAVIAAMGEGPGQQPLLHFEIRVDGQAVDPLGRLPEAQP